MAETKIVVDCTKGTTAYLPLSAAEIAERDQASAAFAQAQIECEAQAQALEDLKTSAKAKLLAGEPLTEEEASVIII